ncbi:MAG: hypothetical protein HQK53_14125 [Oligoflexia bacterium]|nr:hypothetical protein [Oligoflexia bacterium]
MKSSNYISLRKNAEKILKNSFPRKGKENFNELTSEKLKKLLHELEIHQIELEMTNDELKRTADELETSRTRYFELYEFAPVGYVTINEEGGILESTPRRIINFTF